MHRARWPEAGELRKFADNGDPRQLEAVSGALTAIRRSKSTAKVSMKAAVASAQVSGDADLLALVAAAAADLRSAGSITDLSFVEGAGDVAVDVVLA